MGYIGRITVMCIVWFCSLCWAAVFGIMPMNYADSYVQSSFAAALFAVLTYLGWILGKQYDRVKYFSEKDDLTQAYNRRYFYRYAFPKLARKVNRQGQRMSLLLFDINGLKQINDRYGHLAGDKIIIQAADFISNFTRKSDIVARWGGDEFVVLAPNTDEAGAKAMLERVSKDLNAKNSLLKLSAGYAVYPDEHAGLDQLIKKADDRMYAIKQATKPD